VGEFQKPGELGGLFVQEEPPDQDRNTDTSEGLFAFTSFPARVGDLVRIRGTVTEYRGLTELHPVTRLNVCDHARTLPEPATLRLPATRADFEAVENMRVELSQNLVITDLSQLAHFGELVVSSRRLFQSTQLFSPGNAATGFSADSRQDRLIIDDGRTGRDLPVSFDGQDNLTPFSADNPIRTGQEIKDLEGIMHYAFDDYRLQPVRPFMIDATTNTRVSEPDRVGGTLRASVFNVLSYFSTPGSAGPVCGPSRDQVCRGAKTLPEQKRQLQKLTAALLAVDADILALIELENNSEQSMRDVLGALNSSTGQNTWAYVPSGLIGRDAIKVGLLFKPAAVTPEGYFAILDHAVDARFNDGLSRPGLAQTFRLRQNGELLTVIVAHLKSRSCKNAEGPDADQNDGQACFNRARTDAAAALADWSLSDPTRSGSENVLVLGDFNSYRMEDPIRVMQEKGLADLLAAFRGSMTYTFVYDGLAGTLDYAFGNPELATHVTGITVWHINADESAALGYGNGAGKPGSYYSGNAFRSSDHDPVILGLAFTSTHDPSEFPQSEEHSATLGYTLLACMLAVLMLGARGMRKKTTPR